MFRLGLCSFACNNSLLQASLIFGNDCYTTAFDIAGEEICALFQEVLLNSEYKSTVRLLREEQAKGFMQELQEVRFHLRLAINTVQRCNPRNSKEVLHCCKRPDFSVPLNELL